MSSSPSTTQVAGGEGAGELPDLAEAARRAAAADRAWCLVHEPRRAVLWTTAAEGYLEVPADSGLAGSALHGGRAVRLPRAADATLRDGSADDASLAFAAAPGERLLAVPALLDDGRPAGLLVAVRDAAGDEFSAADEAALVRLADLAAPRVAACATGLPAAGDDADATAALPPEGPFRRSAVERLRRGMQPRHDPLRVDPAWGRVVYALLLAAFAAALVYSLVGRVDEYATGVGVVELPGRTNLTAIQAGTVTAVVARPGEPVTPGQVLVRFDDSRERAELERLDKELQVQLVRRLSDPSDPAVEQAVIAVRLERELAEARLAARLLRAPQAGVMSDVWVREGQYVQPGQPVASLAGGATAPTLTILVPGSYRPALEPGMAVRFEVAGYRYAYQHVTVDSIGDEVVGPAEAQRYLGTAQADSVALPGPVVVVKARLPRTFEAEGGTFRYHPGMQGKAEIRVRSEPILLVLVPALKGLTADDDG